MKPSKKSNPKPKAKKLTFEAIGTWWEIDFVTAETQHSKLEKAIRDRIDLFDATYSRFRPDSWVSKNCKQAGKYKVPEDFELMHKFYESLYEITDGKVTPLIGEVMERAGYDSQYSLVPKSINSPKPLDQILSFEGNTLHVKYPCILDYGAAGKGYLVDIIAGLLNKYKVSSYLIDAGGDMYHSPAVSTLSTPVGLEDPNDPKKVIGIVNLGHESLCGSAGNRRRWAGINHIIDPITLESSSDITAVWVVTCQAMLADGLATALFFTDPDILAKHYTFEYVILKWDNSIRVSNNFPGELFYQ